MENTLKTLRKRAVELAHGHKTTYFVLLIGDTKFRLVAADEIKVAEGLWQIGSEIYDAAKVVLEFAAFRYSDRGVLRAEGLI